MAVANIASVGITTTVLVNGILIRDGIPLYKSDMEDVKVSLVIPILSARHFQGMLIGVKISNNGLLILTVCERLVNHEGYYTDECSVVSTVITTYCVDACFLQMGWSKDLGNTAGTSTLTTLRPAVTITPLADDTLICQVRNLFRGASPTPCLVQ